MFRSVLIILRELLNVVKYNHIQKIVDYWDVNLCYVKTAAFWDLTLRTVVKVY
jgi:hypothetical protein